MSRDAAGFVARLDRWTQVVRYHRPEQLARRLWNRVRDRFDAPEAELFAEPPTVRHPLGTWTTSVRAADPHLADKFASGRLALLNREFEVGRPIAWNDLEALGLSPLAAFHLQYHEYLLAVVQTHPNSVWQAVGGWLDAFPFPVRSAASRAAWHPYVLSRRIPVWMELLQHRPPERLGERMLDALARQARRLARRFERDLGGNHLWENARALLAAGCFFRGAEAADWRRLGWTTLAECLETQLFPWREHDERSPMYQRELARGLTRLVRWLEPTEPHAAELCRRAAAEMTTFVDAIRHPDGGLPLFGDTTLDADEPKPPTGLTSGWIGDYFVYRTPDRHALIFDAGDLGPDDLPAHAHADLLGFEMSAFGRRLFVDSGVCEYSGPRRLPLRRSAAHNVMTVDGVELADVWGDFRMGRRGKIVARRAGAFGSARWVRAEHDAYRRLGARVLRFFVTIPDGPWWSVHVTLGAGRRRAVEHLHLHPGVNVALLDSQSARFDLGDRRVFWRLASPSAWRRATGEYSERFNEIRPNPHWMLETDGDLPAVSAWAVSFDEPLDSAMARLEGDRVSLTWETRGARLQFAIPLE